MKRPRALDRWSGSAHRRPPWAARYLCTIVMAVTVGGIWVILTLGLSPTDRRSLSIRQRQDAIALTAEAAVTTFTAEPAPASAAAVDASPTLRRGFDSETTVIPLDRIATPLLGSVNKRITPDGEYPPAWYGHGPDRTPPVAACVVSDTHRFIYMLVEKVGSQTIRSYLTRALCGPVKTAMDPNSNCTSPALNLRNTGGHFTPCRQVPRDKWRTYYAFTSVRNVWARSVSAYTFCRLGEIANIPWAAWCADPDTHLTCYRPRVPIRYPVPVVNGTLRYRRGTNGHWAPLAPRFCAHTGECWMDYVVPLEDMAPHFRAVVSTINARLPAGVPPLPPFKNMRINSQHGAAPPYTWYLPRSELTVEEEAVADEQGVQAEPACVENIRRLYKEDVGFFGMRFEDILPNRTV